MNNLCKAFLPSGGPLVGFVPALSSRRIFAVCFGSAFLVPNGTPEKWMSKRASSMFLRSSWRFCVTASQDGRTRPWVSKIGDVVKESNRKAHLQVVLFSPQIAGNTGCIARTCAAASVGLHLIEPLGFQIDDAKLKRAGLDYWPFVVVKVHHSWGEFMQYFKEQEGEKRLVAFTKRGTCLYTEKKYKAGDWLVFGSETSGLSPEALEACADETSYGGGKVRIPMIDTYVRSLNLSVSAGIGIYEALRQLDVLEHLSGWDQLEVTEDITADIVDDDNLPIEILLKAVEA